MLKLRPFALALGAVGMLTIACGSSGSSEFKDPNMLGDGTQNGGPGSGLGGSSGSSGSSGNPGSVTPGSACANSNAGSNALPVYLVFMFDRSGSMNEDQKWTSCVAGLKGFFSDPSSQGLQASMAFFRQNDECNAAAYANPAVAMHPLPDGTLFAAQLDASRPGGGTPTLPAVQGAIQYAQQVKAGLQNGEKVVVVLVTDGEPNDCNSTPQNVAAAAAAVASTIPTYVIGVGPSLQNLNAIATGGGTAPAIMVATSNPAQITQDLQNAIGQIKAKALGCDYTLPSPPNGQALDVNAVNVNYTPGGGQSQTLPYSRDCADPNGWHYDNPNTPSRVQMCPGICDKLKADQSGGKLDIIFGCKTQGGIPR